MPRSAMKERTQAEQHALLDRFGVARVRLSDEVLLRGDIEQLRAEGWLMGSHAHRHEDLRCHDPDGLLAGLQNALGATVAAGGLPWLAWPEGRCSAEACDVARRAGFQRQFSLTVESGSVEFPGLVHRDIWS